MNQLLQQEKILFDSVMNKETDKDTASAFYDYATFLSGTGVPLVAHLQTQVKEYQNEIAEYEQLYVDIFEKIKTDTQKLKKLVKKLELENDPLFIDRFNDLQNFIDGNWAVSRLTCFDNVRLDYMDILRKLDDLGYNKEIEPYTIVFSSHNQKPKDAYAFEDRKRYYSLLKAFDKKHSQSVVGALTRTMGTLVDLNNPESEYSYTRSSLVAHVDKVHNSIVLNNPGVTKKADSNSKIFWIDGDDIYHYKNGKLTYNIRHTSDPKYIQMFKNIIRYMPQGKNRIRVSEFEKLMPRKDRVGDVYKSNLGNSGTSFHRFLKKNGVHNTHPKSKDPIIKVTKNYINFYNDF
ncbi:hypothetical protein H6776_03065 [Candidatus Nomurabacteria bacterium]|nr:hypothetical protein [Candidatus Nomurabacteria bacterium]